MLRAFARAFINKFKEEDKKSLKKWASQKLKNGFLGLFKSINKLL